MARTRRFTIGAPWWHFEVGLSEAAKGFFIALEGPRAAPWDLDRVVGLLINLGLDDAEILVAGTPLPRVLDELQRFACDNRRQRAEPSQRWIAEPAPSLYRSLSTSELTGDLRALSGLAIWIACLAHRTGKIFERDEVQGARVVLPITKARSALAALLEKPPVGPELAEILPTTLTSAQDIGRAITTAQKLLARLPSLSEIVDPVVDALRLVQQHGHLISTRLPPPDEELSLEQPDRPASLPASFPEHQKEPASRIDIRTEARLSSGSTGERHHGKRSSTNHRRNGRIVASVASLDTEAQHFQGILSAPTPAQREQIAENGETPEDQLSTAEAISADISPREQTAKKVRLFATRYRAAVRHGFWAREQWDAATADEMRALVATLLTERHSGDTSERAAIAIGLLCGATGFSMDRAHAIRLRYTDSEPNSDLIDLAAGTLSMPMPGDDIRFTPKANQRPHLISVGDRIVLHLPAEVVDALRAMPGAPDDEYLFAQPLDELVDHLRTVVSAARSNDGRSTIARFTRAHGLECLARTGDVAISQLICGDTLGTSAVPTAYYSARVSSIQTMYDEVVTVHGYSPSTSSPPPDLYVGSKLLMNETAARLLSAAAIKNLKQRPRSPRVGRELLSLHRQAAVALALQIAAATSFRPNFRIGELTASALCLLEGVGVITDKVTDESHLARLVPLCPMLVSSLAAYGELLEQISIDDSIPGAARDRARAALEGREALLFLTRGQQIVPLTSKDLASRLPRDWPLPLNASRHRLATRLRELGCPGCYVQALMGHLEVGIQPFGTESFMDPTNFLATVSAYVETMLRSEGWKPLLGGSRDLDVYSRHRAALGNDTVGLLDRLDADVRRAFTEARDAVDALKETDGERINELVVQRAHAVCLELASHVSNSVEVGADAVSLLRRTVCEDADTLAELELRVKSLAELLRRGRQDFGWKVKRLPRFHMMEPIPSVFRMDLVGPYETLLRLRTKFDLNLKRGRQESGDDAALGNLLLALILWQGVAEQPRLLRILDSIGSAQPVGEAIDGLLVPIALPADASGREMESSELLRGGVALAAATFKRLSCAPPSLSLIDSVLRSWLPVNLVRPGHGKSLDIMLELARIGHFFEAPPPLREVWSGNIVSISLKSSRVRALLEPQRSHQLLRDVPEPPNNETQSREGKRKPPVVGWERSAYTWLKATLRYARHEEKYFPDEAELFSGAFTWTRASLMTPAGVRVEAVDRIEARLSKWPDDGSVLRSLHRYALDRLKFGTAFSKKVEMKTVYKYTIGAGSPILQQLQGASTIDFDAEDYSELYEACLDGSDPSNQENLSSYLAYFHGFLVSERIAPAVALTQRGSDALCYPEVGHVAPLEATRAIDDLERTQEAKQTADGPGNLFGAAAMALRLGIASGARVSEILLREARDVACNDSAFALMIRKNLYMRVKTFSGTRIVGLVGAMTDVNKLAIRTWLDRALLLKNSRESRRAALFSNIGEVLPISPGVIGPLISAALKHASGDPGARPTWWRHTAAGNELLALFDDDLLASIKDVMSELSEAWLPSCAALRRPLGSMPLCQAHAAVFRARRGHYRMQTSLENYVHTIGLIEPHGGRAATSRLTGQALAQLAGLPHAVIRKRLSRASISIEHARVAIHLLIQEEGQTVAGADQESRLLPSRSMREVPLAARLRLALRALKSGNLNIWFDAMHLTSNSAAHWQRRFREVLHDSAYGMTLAAIGDLEATPSENFMSVRRVSPPISVQRLDDAWIIACVIAATRDAAVAKTWGNVLAELDPRSGCVSARTFDELIGLKNSLSRILSHHSGGYTVVPVIGASASGFGDRRDADWHRIWESLESEPRKENAFRPLPGRLAIGLQIRRVATGRRLKNSLAIAAILAAVYAYRARSSDDDDRKISG